jgi:hypothetical protein
MFFFTYKDALLAGVVVLLLMEDLHVLLDHGVLVGLVLAPRAHALTHFQTSLLCIEP